MKKKVAKKKLTTKQKREEALSLEYDRGNRDGKEEGYRNGYSFGYRAAKEIFDIPNIPKWTTKDGRVIAIADMEESHLRNTICYLQRTLVSRFGSVRWLSQTTRQVVSLGEMLKEAETRGMEV